MNKKLLLAAIAIAFITYGCGSGEKKEKQEVQTEETVTASIPQVKVDDLLSQADGLVDQEINLVGNVSHTCKHSGKRCFLEGDKENYSIRVEAGGDITGFNRELIGTEIAVKGTLKERRLSAEYIDQWEEKVKAKEAAEDGSAETCAAENNNISKMRKWMADNGKDYYSIYYVDGLEYEQL